MTDPWEWYIYLHEWLNFMVNVGKYTSPMDPMGIESSPNLSQMKKKRSVYNPLKHFETCRNKEMFEKIVVLPHLQKSQNDKSRYSQILENYQIRIVFLLQVVSM